MSDNNKQQTVMYKQIKSKQLSHKQPIDDCNYTSIKMVSERQQYIVMKKTIQRNRQNCECRLNLLLNCNIEKEEMDRFMDRIIKCNEFNKKELKKVKKTEVYKLLVKVEKREGKRWIELYSNMLDQNMLDGSIVTVIRDEIIKQKMVEDADSVIMQRLREDFQKIKSFNSIEKKTKQNKCNFQNKESVNNTQCKPRNKAENSQFKKEVKVNTNTNKWKESHKKQGIKHDKNKDEYNDKITADDIIVILAIIMITFTILLFCMLMKEGLVYFISKNNIFTKHWKTRWI